MPFLILGTLVSGACSSADGPGGGASRSRLVDPSYDDLVAMASFAQYAVYDGGFVDFYLGEDVLREYLETADFVPDSDAEYTLIHMPRSIVESAQLTGEPVTWSLCRAADEIRIFHQVVGSQWEAEVGQVRNCTPWVQHYDGRMTIEYRGGEEGVFGFVQGYVYPPGQIPVDGVDAPDGLLMVGVTVRAAMPSPCEESAGPQPSFLRLGMSTEDPAPDDPLLEDCVPPDGAWL